MTVIPSHILDKYEISDVDVQIFVENFNEDPGTVLIAGAHDEPTAHMLSDIGFSVLGIDLRTYDKNLPACNYTYYRGDFCSVETQDYAKKFLGNKPGFDVFIALSAIEHFGMCTYAEGMFFPYYDIIALRRAWDLLRVGGKAYITVPVGANYIENSPHWRVYDINSLVDRLVQDFKPLIFKARIAGQCILDGKLETESRDVTFEEVCRFTDLSPHITGLLIMEKVAVNRLAPDGR